MFVPVWSLVFLNLKPTKQKNTKNQTSPACSFHLWSVGSESFSYPWCFVVVDTNVVVSQVWKCLPGVERGSSARDLLLQPKNSQTQSSFRGRTHTHISLPRCGEATSMNPPAVGRWEWREGAAETCEVTEWRTSVHSLCRGDESDKLPCSCCAVRGRRSSPVWERQTDAQRSLRCRTCSQHITQTQDKTAQGTLGAVNQSALLKGIKLREACGVRKWNWKTDWWT